MDGLSFVHARFARITAFLLLTAIFAGPAGATSASPVNQESAHAPDDSAPTHGQSPVDLSNPYVVDLKDVQFFYPETAMLTVIDKGHTVQAALQTPGAYIVVDGARFNLVQFHTHVPAEHHVEGQGFDLELHFVHKNPDTGELAVVGLLANVPSNDDTPNSALAPFTSLLTNAAIPRKHNEEDHQETSLGNISMNLINIFPADKRAYRYPGSLTTTPYSENVRWIVIKQPISISHAQVSSVIKFTGKHTARAVQPTLKRPILLDSTVDAQPALNRAVGTVVKRAQMQRKRPLRKAVRLPA